MAAEVAAIPSLRLLTPSAWAAKYFAAGSRPSPATVRRWILSGEVPGRKIGGSWYIDELSWLAGGDALVEHVLKAG